MAAAAHGLTGEVEIVGVAVLIDQLHPAQQETC